MDRSDLEALREKYEVMLMLRLAHDRARADPNENEPDPTRAMAALAGTFPGALREIDELPIEVVRARIDALHRALADASAIEPWMAAWAAFHRLARGALAAKRWLGRREAEPREARRTAFVAAATTFAHAADALAWADHLDDVARPPRGRLLDLVFPRLARELGVDIASARRLIHPPRPRRASD